MATIQVTDGHVVMFFDVLGSVFMVGGTVFGGAGRMGMMVGSIGGFVEVVSYFVGVPVLLLPHHLNSTVIYSVILSYLASMYKVVVNTKKAEKVMVSPLRIVKGEASSPSIQ